MAIWGYRNPAGTDLGTIMNITTGQPYITGYKISTGVDIGSYVQVVSTPTSTVGYKGPDRGIVWTGVSYGNNIWTILTSSGDKVGITSSDQGLNWSSFTGYTFGYSWNTISYGNSLFIAASATTIYMTSTDGRTWTNRTHPGSILGVNYGNGQWVALGYNTSSAYTSPDGITWTARTLPAVKYWFDVIYANGLWVGCSISATGSLATSPDGITWTQRAVLDDLVGSAYGNGIWVAVSYNNANKTLTSPDGITWTQRVLPTPSAGYWWGIVFGGGIFVAYTTNGQVATSTDGINWTLRTIALASTRRCFYGNGKFIIPSNGINANIFVSTDGINWTRQYTLFNDIGTLYCTSGCNAACTSCTGCTGCTSCVSGCADTCEDGCTSSCTVSSKNM